MQLLCTWGAPVMLVGDLLGWAIAGILPCPPAANDQPERIVAWYANNPTAVRAGLLVALVSVCGVGPLIAVISTQMLRIEGRRPVLSLLQLAGGLMTWVMLFIPQLIMNVAAFRPDREPGLTVTLTDLAWLLFVTPIGPFITQNLAIAGAVLTDRAPMPVFPRWVGYANLWIALLFCPASLAYLFKGGPFAWQGIFAFWLGLVMYSAWLVVMFITVRRAIHTDELTDLPQPTQHLPNRPKPRRDLPWTYPCHSGGCQPNASSSSGWSSPSHRRSRSPTRFAPHARSASPIPSTWCSPRRESCSASRSSTYSATSPSPNSA